MASLDDEVKEVRCSFVRSIELRVYLSLWVVWLTPSFSPSLTLPDAVLLSRRNFPPTLLRLLGLYANNFHNDTSTPHRADTTLFTPLLFS